MNERRARAILHLEYHVNITERHIRDAWADSDKSRDAAHAATILRDLVRANMAISRLPRIQCWADENDNDDNGSFTF